MEDFINISTLNDFIFCPYSIYLHNVYMDTDEDLYHATPQTRGKIAHASLDAKNYSTRKDVLTALPVYSSELGIMGKIDLYKAEERILIERKFEMKQIFQGQIYQLWGEYFCMIEMGYPIDKIAFYETSKNKMKYMPMPTEADKCELKDFIPRFKEYDPESSMTINANKCRHCIYCNLCDKTEIENVYS